MYSTRQQSLQYSGLASQIINDDKLAVLRHSVQISIKLTQRMLLKRYLSATRISALTLLNLKSESLELHRAILCADIGTTERNILLGYINQNIDSIDEAISVNPDCRALIN
ncbi:MULTISPECIES: hypothetical protein [unclassified Shewanella]|uniref:hypothetical protein n=1 Tax=unclassified Shewanella TaxID=196818 RepID=UPI001BBE3974|nr:MULTISPECIES: hypothetical protein [unclassified Shewanella]GIU10637.1 hypothetical protein TUM4444_15200 [Shewanella sp. MBTL60-112-B1]GIU40301.1 hypothetical protein TUM4445_39170 [Shewanella sp. MBTL60-112-B2]